MTAADLEVRGTADGLVHLVERGNGRAVCGRQVTTLATAGAHCSRCLTRATATIIDHDNEGASA